MRYTRKPDSLIYDERPKVTFNDNVLADTQAADTGRASSSNNV